MLNFSPWTGWLAFEEFDLLALGAIAAGLGRLAARPALSADAVAAGSSRRCSTGAILAIGFGGLGLWGVCRGIADAGGWSFGWFDGYSQPLNSIRVAKSLFFALALWPVLQEEVQHAGERATRRLALGMQVGLGLVGLAVLWERVAYPGLLDFSSRYRTTALFWEMHVGGAAIDAYLALATPFAAWTVWSARSRRSWLTAAALALLTGYACLTTFSRGVYVGVAAPLLALGIGWWIRRLGISARAAWLGLAQVLAGSAAAAGLLILAFDMWGYPGVAFALVALLALLLLVRHRMPSLHWRKLAAVALRAALLTEAVAVIGGGTFMRARMASAERDFGNRMAHWTRGLALLDSPADWLLGIGLGRLPARYSRSAPDGEFSGALELVAAESDRNTLKVFGP